MRFKQNIGRITALLSIILATAAPLLPAYGANSPNNPTGSFNLLASPLPISLAAKPGTSVGADLRIQNTGNDTENLKVTILKFGPSGENGQPALVDPVPGDEFVKWAHFSQDHFTAEPKVWKTIHMSIDLPKTAAFGYYYAVVFSRASQEITKNNANLTGAVATLVLLEAQVPNAKRNVDVMSFSSAKNVYEFLPADFTVRLQNTGNVHVAPRGNVFITQGKKPLDTLEVNFNKGAILPASNRQFTTEWKSGYPVYETKEADGKVVRGKDGKPEHKLKWSDFNPNNIRIGRYTAHLVMAYDNGSRDVPIESTLTFWVIPWRILGAVLIVSLLVLAGLWGIVRSLKQSLSSRKR